MAAPLPNAGYLVNLTPSDDEIVRDLVIQAWLAQIVATVAAGGGGGGLSPIAAYSTLSNNTAGSATPVAVQTLTLGTPGFADTGVELQLTGSSTGFLQEILQNTNAGTGASADIIVNNDQGTATTHYGDFGINSSTFTGTGSFAIAGATYLYSQTGDLVLGSNTANAVHFVVNNGATDVITLSNKGEVNYTPYVRTSGVVPYWSLTPPADTGLTASTEAIGANFATATRTFVDGTIALQRERYFAGPTYNKTTALLTITDSFNAYFDKPIAGAGVSLTRPHTLGIVDSTSAISSITGAFIVAATLGTTATSVGIGAGNINAGGSIVAGGNLTISGNSQLTGVTGIGQGAVATTVLSVGGSFNAGALPSGATTAAPYITNVASTVSVTGTNTATTYQGNYFGAPTISNASAGVITDGFNSIFKGPLAVAVSQTVTRSHTVGIVDATSAASAITGALIVATTLGTAATSVGVGGGNVNAGGTITSGGGMSVGTTVTSYNGVATAGNGLGVVVAAPRQTAVTNATATLATYTVPAADSSYIITANVQVTAATTAAMTVVCTYTDETNTSRAQTIPFCQLAGTFLTSITNVTGTGPYEGASLHIRCKASTTIVFTTAGTVTGITYNIQGTVIQTA